MMMVTMRGLAVAPGVGIGRMYFKSHQKHAIPEYNIDKNDITGELERFREALAAVDEELCSLHESVSEAKSKETYFVAAHRLILQDPSLHDTIEKWLHEKLNNVESLLFHFAAGVEKTLQELEGDVFKERNKDMQDVTQRVIDALMGKKRDQVLQELRHECVVFTYDLYPSDAVTLDSRYIKGLATESSGITSHTAILARAFGIPAVMGLKNLLCNFHKGAYASDCLAIVDGDKGEVILHPDEETLAAYRWRQEQEQNISRQISAADLRPKVCSLDGQDVYLYANMGALGELSNDLLSSSSGIGLFRSEFLFLESIPSEEEQYRAYVKIMEAMAAEQEVTIRTIDLGGDKIPVTGLLAESNPLLGCRAIRLAMAYPQELFRPQIRAIYRAAAYGAQRQLGQLRLLLPMISSHIELMQALAFIAKTLAELEKEGLHVPKVPIGAMIELPSAALCADIIAKDVDFFSIGTNDLVQYTLGIDRVNEKVAHLYDPLQFGVLKLIQFTIISAKREGIPVSMCGEMASEPCATAILLGLGLRHFSMNPYSLPKIAQAICGYDILDCEELANRYISMHNYEKAHQYLLDWHKKYNVEIDIREWKQWQS